MRSLIGSLLCYFGRHDWHDELGEWDGTRTCTRCDKTRQLVKEFGKWFEVVALYRTTPEGD